MPPPSASRCRSGIGHGCRGRVRTCCVGGTSATTGWRGGQPARSGGVLLRHGRHSACQTPRVAKPDLWLSVAREAPARIRDELLLAERNARWSPPTTEKHTAAEGCAGIESETTEAGAVVLNHVVVEGSDAVIPLGSRGAHEEYGSVKNQNSSLRTHFDAAQDPEVEPALMRGVITDGREITCLDRRSLLRCDGGTGACARPRRLGCSIWRRPCRRRHVGRSRDRGRVRTASRHDEQGQNRDTRDRRPSAHLSRHSGDPSSRLKKVRRPPERDPRRSLPARRKLCPVDHRRSASHEQGDVEMRRPADPRPPAAFGQLCSDAVAEDLQEHSGKAVGAVQGTWSPEGGRLHLHELAEPDVPSRPRPR